MSLSAAWEELIALWRRDGRLLFTLALAFFALPGTLLALIAPTPEAMARSSVAALFLLFALGISLVGQLAISRIVLARGERVADSIRFGAQRLFSVFGAMILALFPLLLPLVLVAEQLEARGGAPSGGLALIFLVILAALLFVVTRMMLAIPIAAAEPGNAAQLVKRCFALSRGNALKLAALLVLAVTTLGIVMIAVELVAGTLVILALGQPDPLTVSALAIGLLTQVPQALVAAGYVSLLSIVYRQLAAD